MNAPGYFDIKNQMNIARWRERWALQGGSSLWRARDLVDCRDTLSRKRHEALQTLLTQQSEALQVRNAHGS